MIITKNICKYNASVSYISTPKYVNIPWVLLLNGVKKKKILILPLKLFKEHILFRHAYLLKKCKNKINKLIIISIYYLLLVK